MVSILEFQYGGGRWIRFSAEKPRRLQQSPGLLPRAAFRIHKKSKKTSFRLSNCWWGKVDSNHRRHRQQIYSLSPLATREIPHVHMNLELVDGFEPPTC